MEEVDVLQSLFECVERFVSEEDVDSLKAGRYLTRGFRLITALLSGSSIQEDHKTRIIKHFLSQASKKINNSISADDDAFEFPDCVEQDGVVIPEDWKQQYGSLVWTKLSKNDPWWPSYICDPRYLENDNPEGLRKMAFQNIGKKHLVYYFGESSNSKHGFIKNTAAQMRDYCTSRLEFESQGAETGKKLLDAALPLADSEGVLEPARRLVWFKFLREINLYSQRKKKNSSVLNKKDPISTIIPIANKSSTNDSISKELNANTILNLSKSDKNILKQEGDEGTDEGTTEVKKSNQPSTYKKRVIACEDEDEEDEDEPDRKKDRLMEKLDELGYHDPNNEKKIEKEDALIETTGNNKKADKKVETKLSSILFCCRATLGKKSEDDSPAILHSSSL